MPTPLMIEYDASQITVRIDPGGKTAMLGLLTDKGQVVVGLRRATLERLVHQAKHELERVPAPTRKR